MEKIESNIFKIKPIDQQDMISLLSHALLLLLFKFMLERLYITFVYPSFAYMGYGLDISPAKTIESYILLAVLVFITPRGDSRLSHIFLNMQLSLMIVPMLSYYGLNNGSRVFMYVVCFSYVIQVFLLKPQMNPQQVFFRGSTTQRLIEYLLFFIVIITIVLSVVYNGLPGLDALRLSDVYEIRADIVLPRFLSYLSTWTAKILLPFLIAFSLVRKKYLLCVFYILMQLVMFLIYAHRSWLFLIPLVLFVYWAQKKKLVTKLMNLLLALGTSVLYVGQLLGDSFFTITSLIVRRALMTPAMLKFAYYDFFSGNPKLYLAEGQIGNLFNISSPYSKPVTALVADYVRAGSTTVANTGYHADAYANFGLPGILIFAVLLAIIIRLMEKYSSNISLAVVVSSAAFSLYSLNDGALLTNLLTGGMLLLLILFIFFNSHAGIASGIKSKQQSKYIRNRKSAR